MSTNNGMTLAVFGTMSRTAMRPKKRLRPGKRSRASTKPLTEPSRMHPNMAQAATMTDERR